MGENPTPMLLPFDGVTVETVSPSLPEQTTCYEPSDEALAAFERLQGWLMDPRGVPVSEGAGQALYALARALLEGKRGWHRAAEDWPRALSACPPVPESEALRDDLESALGCLHAAMLDDRGLGR